MRTNWYFVGALALALCSATLVVLWAHALYRLLFL